jgi:hypothetical protein
MDCNTSRSQNGTDSTDSGISKSERLIIGVFLSIMTVLTIFGNILVLYAIKREKQLQTKFNIYIANLAITDLTVAITAMTFYTTDNILGYWPFGEFLCGVWIFNDVTNRRKGDNTMTKLKRTKGQTIICNTYQTINIKRMHFFFVW